MLDVLSPSAGNSSALCLSFDQLILGFGPAARAAGATAGPGGSAVVEEEADCCVEEASPESAGLPRASRPLDNDEAEQVLRVVELVASSAL